MVVLARDTGRGAALPRVLLGVGPDVPGHVVTRGQVLHAAPGTELQANLAMCGQTVPECQPLGVGQSGQLHPLLEAGAGHTECSVLIGDNILLLLVLSMALGESGTGTLFSCEDAAQQVHLSLRLSVVKTEFLSIRLHI